jgi:hypothetical protein
MERNVGVVCGKNAKQQKLTVRITFIIMSQHIGENPYVSTNSDVKKRWETSGQISGRLEGEVPFKGQ